MAVAGEESGGERDGRIGLVAFWKSYDRKETLRAVEIADEAGYDSFWVAEAWGYEAFSLLTEMALRTKRIKLGTGIVNVFSRSPGVLAMSAATLEQVSEGRFILGLGTSGRRLIEEFHRTTYHRPLTRLRDTIRVVRGLLRGEPASPPPENERALTLGVPRRNRDIPIYCGSLHPKAIEAAGELADGWMPMFWSYRRIDQGIEWLRRGAQIAGRNVKEITVAPFTAVVPSGSKYGERTVRRMIAFYVGGMGPYYHAAMARLGLGESADRVRSLWAAHRWREAESAVSDEMIEALTIWGELSYCREQLQERRRYGIDMPILILPVGVDGSVMKGYLEAFAPAS
jgi:alkanesulfonate monooxygenase SsuD/methylene tetrahydromethanopterin reductase-like flavin-dependent oxidoreductase (luciferase family)